MKKEEYIEKYGEEAYENAQIRTKRWIEKNPEKVRAMHERRSRKDGIYYERMREYHRRTIQGKRAKIRNNHRYIYRQFKQIIAPESQLHHQWIPKTADYTGIALVEADQHIYGFIDVIHVLDGEITLFREAEIIGGTKQ